MKIVSPDYEVLTAPHYTDMLRNIELAGRTCYKSERRMTPTSGRQFVKMLIERGHEAMLEHGGTITVKFICDRGVSHQLVRHRLFSFAQESTRYCRYKDGIQVIVPTSLPEDQYETFTMAMLVAEDAYLKLLKAKVPAEIARAVLPTAVKTEVIVSGNPRQWRQFFKLRCAADAHPDIRQLSKAILAEFAADYPAVFGDLKEEFICG